MRRGLPLFSDSISETPLLRTFAHYVNHYNNASCVTDVRRLTLLNHDDSGLRRDAQLLTVTGTGTFAANCTTSPHFPIRPSAASASCALAVASSRHGRCQRDQQPLCIPTTSRMMHRRGTPGSHVGRSPFSVKLKDSIFWLPSARARNRLYVAGRDVTCRSASATILRGLRDSAHLQGPNCRHEFWAGSTAHRHFFA